MTTTIETPTETPLAPPASPHVRARTGRQVWVSVYRHHLRLLRRQSIAWILVVAGVGAMVAAGYADTYPTEVERERMAASIEGVPAFEALFGRTVEMATMEGFLLWRWGGFAVLVVAVWGMVSSIKLLRGAEDSGHIEPLRAGMITPRGLVAAVLAALGTMYLLLAVAVAVLHTAAGMDAATAWTFGAVLGLLAATFAGVGALAAQVTATRRLALAVTGAALGGALVVRVLASGSAMPTWLYGMTPFGWASYLHEADQARGPVLVAFVVLVSALVAGALAFANRDLHAGLVGETDPSVDHARAITSPEGLAAHLVVGPLLAWGAGIVGAGLVFGLLADDFATAMADLPDTVAIAEQIGWAGLDTPEGVVASLVGGFLLLFMALFAVAQVAAIREEEASWRIEHLLVRPVGRARWLLGRTAAAAGAIAAVAAATMMAAGLGTAITGAPMAAGDVVAAWVNLLPLPLMFLGAGVALVGIVPRSTVPVGYGLVIATYLFDLIGGLLELPEAVLELSPFRHVAAVPAVSMSVGPALMMLAVGAVTLAAGVVAFRRRDLKEA